MLKWVYECSSTPNSSEPSIPLKRMLRRIYGSNVNLLVVLNDIWNAEIWFQNARAQHKSKKEIVDCCGPFGNLHFLLLLLYPYLGHLPADWIFCLKNKKQIFLPGSKKNTVNVYINDYY